MDLYVTITLIGFAAVFVLGLALCFRTADKRTEERIREVLTRVDALGLALEPHAAAVPAGRGLQRLPVVVLPSVARRVVDVTRDPETPAPPSSAARSAIVDVDMSVSVDDDTTRGRWLRHILGHSSPAPQEQRGFQGLRLVRPVEVAQEDDTPAPEAQRAPVLPPPSSSSPRRPGRQR